MQITLTYKQFFTLLDHWKNNDKMWQDSRTVERMLPLAHFEDDKVTYELEEPIRI